MSETLVLSLASLPPTKNDSAVSFRAVDDVSDTTRQMSDTNNQFVSICESVLQTDNTFDILTNKSSTWTPNSGIMSTTNSSSQTITRQTKSSGRSGRSKNQIRSKDPIYPQLIRGLELDNGTQVSQLSDPEWREIIENTAYGVLPRGFIRRITGITVVYMGRKETLMPDPLDPLGSVRSVIKFYQKMGGMKTQIDRVIENDMLNVIHNKETIVHTKWTTLNAKQKTQLTQLFVQTQTIKFNLNTELRNHLCTYVSILSDNGVLNDSNVLFSNGNIDRITLIDIDQNLVRLNTDVKLKMDKPRIDKSTPDNIYFTNFNFGRKTKLKGFVPEWNNLCASIALAQDQLPDRKIHSNGTNFETFISQVYNQFDQRQVIFDATNLMMSPRPDFNPIPVELPNVGIGSAMISLQDARNGLNQPTILLG